MSSTYGNPLTFSQDARSPDEIAGLKPQGSPSRYQWSGFGKGKSPPENPGVVLNQKKWFSADVSLSWGQVFVGFENLETVQEMEISWTLVVINDFWCQK